jgi:hypothetical protein
VRSDDKSVQTAFGATGSEDADPGTPATGTSETGRPETEAETPETGTPETGAERSADFDDDGGDTDTST